MEEVVMEEVPMGAEVVEEEVVMAVAVAVRGGAAGAGQQRASSGPAAAR